MKQLKQLQIELCLMTLQLELLHNGKDLHFSNPFKTTDTTTWE